MTAPSVRLVALEWNGMEWNGMEWNGMEWNGMEWNGMECKKQEGMGKKNKMAKMVSFAVRFHQSESD